MANAFDLIGSSSSAVNDQLVPRVRAGNYYPRPISAAGPGGAGVPAFPPQTTSGVGGGPGAGSAGASAGGAAAAQTAASNPWSPVSSPVPWLIGFFLAGVLLLRFVHHGY